MGLTLLYTTLPHRRQAQEIANELLDQKAIACANIVPSRSIYSWKGKRVSAPEVILLLKTTNQNAEKARKILKGMHPYETPCILTLPVGSNSAYERWVKEELGGR